MYTKCSFLCKSESCCSNLERLFLVYQHIEKYIEFSCKRSTFEDVIYFLKFFSDKKCPCKKRKKKTETCPLSNEVRLLSVYLLFFCISINCRDLSYLQVEVLESFAIKMRNMKGTLWVYRLFCSRNYEEIICHFWIFQFQLL